MNIRHEYGLTWRYEFNHSKSGIVTFGETKAVHCASMNEGEWRLDDDIVEELYESVNMFVYEYKNLGVLKNYIGSFSSDVRDNIEKTGRKAGMIFPPALTDGKNKSTHLCTVLETSVSTLTFAWQ